MPRGFYPEAAGSANDCKAVNSREVVETPRRGVSTAGPRVRGGPHTSTLFLPPVLHAAHFGHILIERQADVTVPLVFLDTPQIGLLARVRRDDPGRYSAFLNVWNTFGCTLVLTLAQEHELRRYENPAGRELRYQLLADLAPIRRDVCTEHQVGDPCTLIEREILGAVRNRGMRILNGPAPNQLRDWSDVLPGRLTASEGRHG